MHFTCCRCGGSSLITGASSDKAHRRGQAAGSLLGQDIEHIDHAVKAAGVDHVGLGLDFDGAWMPKRMEDVSMLPQITEALMRKGYSNTDIVKILGSTLRAMTRVEQVAKRRK